jgi:hypothetical protein
MVELQPATPMNSLDGLRAEVRAKGLDQPFKATEPTVDDFTFQLPEAWRELITVEQYAAVHHEDAYRDENAEQSDSTENLKSANSATHENRNSTKNSKSQTSDETLNSVDTSGNKTMARAEGIDPSMESGYSASAEGIDPSIESGYSASAEGIDPTKESNMTASDPQTPYAKYEVNFLYTPKQSGLLKASMLKIMVFDIGEWKRAEQVGGIPQVSLLTETSKLVYAVNLPTANPYPDGDDHLMYDKLLLSFHDVKRAFTLPG